MMTENTSEETGQAKHEVCGLVLLATMDVNCWGLKNRFFAVLIAAPVCPGIVAGRVLGLSQAY